MVPNINSRGKSFKGVTQYVLHDIEKVEMQNGETYHRHLETNNRVGFTETANMYTDDIEKAAKVMAFTDENREYLRGNGAGRKASAGNVYHYSIAWRDGQDPDQDHMKQTAHDSVSRLGLSDHQYYMVEHTDEEHKHVHIVVNLVHPETGNIANVYKDRYKLDRWSNEYEQEHGIVCENRAQKYIELDNERPAFSEKERREQYKQIATNVYNLSDNGQAFKSALESEGLSLAQGNKRGFVVVDKQGDVYALNRLIDGAKAKDVKARLEGVDRSTLPLADELTKQRQQEEMKQQQEQQKQIENVADKLTENLQEERNQDHDNKQREIEDNSLVGLSAEPLQDLSVWLAEVAHSGRREEQGTEAKSTRSMVLAGSSASALHDNGLRQVRTPQTESPENRRISNLPVYKNEEHARLSMAGSHLHFSTQYERFAKAKRDVEEAQAQLNETGALSSLTGKKGKLQKQLDEKNENLENVRHRLYELSESKFNDWRENGGKYQEDISALPPTRGALEIELRLHDSDQAEIDSLEAEIANRSPMQNFVANITGRTKSEQALIERIKARSNDFEVRRDEFRQQEALRQQQHKEATESRLSAIVAEHNKREQMEQEKQKQVEDRASKPRISAAQMAEYQRRKDMNEDNTVLPIEDDDDRYPQNGKTSREKWEEVGNLQAAKDEHVKQEFNEEGLKSDIEKMGVEEEYNEYLNSNNSHAQETQDSWESEEEAAYFDELHEEWEGTPEYEEWRAEQEQSQSIEQDNDYDLDP